MVRGCGNPEATAFFIHRWAISEAVSMVKLMHVLCRCQNPRTADPLSPIGCPKDSATHTLASSMCQGRWYGQIIQMQIKLKPGKWLQPAAPTSEPQDAGQQL